MKNVLRHLVLGGMLITVSTALYAVDVTVEFSAEAVQMTPMQPPMVVKMYVSKNAVRTEMEMNGQSQVEIIYPQQQRRVMLLPSSKRYVEQQSAKPMAAVKKKKFFNPCDELPNADCRLLGKETISGRKTQKWEITKVVNGRQMRSLHWIDSNRRMAIREFFADGTVSELSFVGKEKINDRQTEKWQMQVTAPDGRKMQSQQWYDPELKMAIREELAGGYLREIRNIKIGKQKKSLFTVPKDYQKHDMSAIPSRQPSSQYAPRR